MNPLVELNLAMILFVPWYAILAVLFWLFPRQPRGLARTAFDSASLALAAALSAWSMYWSIDTADPQYGDMWRQILATSVSYGVFLAVMTVAVVVRWRWLRGSGMATTSSPQVSPEGSAP